LHRFILVRVRQLKAGQITPPLEKERKEMLKKKLVVLLSGALLAVLLLAFAGTASAAPPEPINSPPRTVSGVCDFPLLADLSGKEKTKELPGGRTLLTSPGLRVTLTNLEEPANQVTYVITGSFLTTELSDGNLFVVARGRNIIFGPDIGGFLTIGRFTFVGVEAAEGDIIALTPPTGEGRVIDLCARLA